MYKYDSTLIDKVATGGYYIMTQRRLVPKPRIEYIYEKTRYPNPKLAESTLKTANSDLKGSIRDYDSRDYASSIYRLQQSVEKGCKSFGYKLGIIEEQTVGHEISHYSTRIFFKIIKRIEGNYNHMEKKFRQLGKIIPELRVNENFKNALTYFSQMQKFTRNVQDVLTEMSSNSVMYRNMSYKDMEELIVQLEEYDKEIEKQEAVFIEYLEKLEIEYNKKQDPAVVESTSLGLNLTEEKTIQAKETIKSMAEGVDEGFFLSLLACYAEVIPLLFLAAITQPHNMTSRYPMDNIPPEEIYTIDYPIVKLSPRIHTICAKALDELNTAYKEMDKNTEIQDTTQSIIGESQAVIDVPIDKQ